jgi:hypothetical protein
VLTGDTRLYATKAQVFMHSTDTGVPPEPVKFNVRGTCAANLLYRAVVAASGEIKPCNRDKLLCC